MRLTRIIRFVAVIQTVLFLTHYFLYQTWTFSNAGESAGALWLKLSLFVLSISFVIATLLAHRYTNPALRAFYRAAAIWLGLLTFLFIASVAAWMILGVASLAGVAVNFHGMVECCSVRRRSPDFTVCSMRTGHELREPRCAWRTCPRT